MPRSGLPFDQPRADGALERRNLLADRGLAVPKPRRCALERSLL
jgi:hypothetical protein